jgi:hypothetical protein
MGCSCDKSGCSTTGNHEQLLDDIELFFDSERP